MSGGQSTCSVYLQVINLVWNYNKKIKHGYSIFPVKVSSKNIANKFCSVIVHLCQKGGGTQAIYSRMNSEIFMHNGLKRYAWR